MSDEQTRLLQEILEAVKEQTACTKQCRDEAISVQHTVLNRQKSLAIVGLVFMLVMVGILVYTLAQ